MNDKKLFLLDAYALIYRAYYALIRSPRVTSKGLNTSAIFGFVNTLEDVLKKENPTHIAVAFDPHGGTFRHEAYPEYKAQREAQPEDIRKSVPYIKEIVKAYNIPILEVPGYEADDVIGTLAVKAASAGYDTYMMTPDKDYGQLVAPHISIYKPGIKGGSFELRGVNEICEKYDIQSPAQVIDILALMGDAVDNVPGCPGVGEKTAIKLIKEFNSVEGLLDNTDKLKGALKEKVVSNAEQIRFSKFLVTIKTDVPIALDEKALVREEINVPEILKIFDELEFRALASRIIKNTNGAIVSETKKQTKKQSAASQQPSLFDFANNEEDAEVSAELLPSLSNINDTAHTYTIVSSNDDILDLQALLGTVKEFSMYVAASGDESMTADIMGISIALQSHNAYYVPLNDAYTRDKYISAIKGALEDNTILKISDDIKRSYILLQRIGIQLSGEFFDTDVAHYLIQPEMRHGIPRLAETYLRYVTIQDENMVSSRGKNKFEGVTTESVGIYACERADVVSQLREHFQPRLAKESLLTLFHDVEMPLTRVLANMEMTGARINVATLKEYSKVLTERMEGVEREIYSLAEGVFNISSSRQVGEVLFDKLKIDEKAKKTKSGQYSTTEDVLEKLRDRHPIVDKILEARGLKKLLSTYVDALPALINNQTGRIHTSYNQTVTATGRLSSTNPNLQNIPIRDDDGKEIRKAFIPDDGCVFMSADYSQIELRLVADLSGDENMIAAFKMGDDIHQATAAKIYKVPTDEVTRTQRSHAKTANFGIIYGISVFGLAERLRIPRADAKALIDGYFESFPKVKEYMQKSIDVAREQGYVTTLFGRKRMLPDIKSANSVVRSYAERNAINAPIQGTAADIIKIAMVRIYNRFATEGLKAKMIIQVHDELDFSVPTDEVEQVTSIVREEMEGACQLSVPLTADTGVGANWLEAH